MRVKQAAEWLEKGVKAERLGRMKSRLGKRTVRLQLVLDGVLNMGNVLACMRTADNYGIQCIHVVRQPQARETHVVGGGGGGGGDMDHGYGRRLAGRHTGSYLNHVDGADMRSWDAKVMSERDGVSFKVHQWLTIQYHASPEACAVKLKERGFQVLASDFQPGALCFTPNHIRKNTCFTTVFPHIQSACNAASRTPGASSARDKGIAMVFGNEKHGISKELRDAADATFTLPMNGFSQSYNVSVAVAIALTTLANTGGILASPAPETSLDPTISGLTEDDRDCIYLQWLIRSGKHAEKILRGKGFTDILDYLATYESAHR